MVTVISDAALNKIIAAAGKLSSSKRDELRRELEDAAALYSDAVVFQDLGRDTALSKRLNTFRKAAAIGHSAL